MRYLLGASAVLAMGLSAAAQSPSQPARGIVNMQATNASGCPVGFEARHSQVGAVVNVSPGERHPQQSYRLTFSPTPGQSITEVKVTLHGLSGQHIVPASQAGKSPAEDSESFNLSPNSGSDHRFHSLVRPEKLTGVEWIELDELSYADGGQWHASAAATCRIRPNGYMLVTGTG